MAQITMNRRSFLAAAAATALVPTAAAFAEEAPAGGDYDIVVVGMGGAGMCAALAASEAGVEKIVILEKNAMEGGNTIFASSGMNASETTYQKDQGIEDSTDLFIQETITGGHNWNNVELVTQMCEGSAAAIDWLAEHGLVLDNITTTGGMSVPRCHRPTDGSAVGAAYVPTIAQAVVDAGIEVVYNCRATELVVDESGAVTGVVCEDGTQYNAKAVILTSGGFGSNKDLVKMYRPDLETFVSTNAASITGDGMVMAQHAGANLIQMSQIQIHPTVFADGSLVAEGVRGGGGILVNNAGDRFTNEMGTRDVVSSAEMTQPDGKVWVVYDQAVYDNNKACANYENKEMSVKADDLAGLADTLGIPADELQTTIDTYNQSVDGAEDPFGRTTGFVSKLETAPFYAIAVYPGIHHCMGGIYVDSDSQALTIEGNKIAGLFAAGEVTGGIHGSNRIGGNAVCDITVMGINAGQKAAASIA